MLGVLKEKGGKKGRLVIKAAEGREAERTAVLGDEDMKKESMRVGAGQ